MSKSIENYIDSFNEIPRPPININRIEEGFSQIKTYNINYTWDLAKAINNAIKKNTQETLPAILETHHTENSNTTHSITLYARNSKPKKHFRMTITKKGNEPLYKRIGVKDICVNPWWYSTQLDIRTINIHTDILDPLTNKPKVFDYFKNIGLGLPK